MRSSASPLESILAALDALGDAAAAAVFRASDAAFGPWTVAVLLGTGLFLTVRLRWVQVRHLPDALRSLRPAKAGGDGALTPFQAFMTALAASVGTGNIAGVATAIVSGGPGALFWIWCYGFFATAIKFTEAVLGIRYRVAGDGVPVRGPDALPARRARAAAAGMALRPHRGGRRPDHHDLHPAQLDRGGAREPLPGSHARDRRRGGDR